MGIIMHNDNDFMTILVNGNVNDDDDDNDDGALTMIILNCEGDGNSNVSLREIMMNSVSDNGDFCDKDDDYVCYDNDDDSLVTVVLIML